MNTDQLIKQLRNSMPPGPITQAVMLETADRLEELQRANKNTLADLALAISERAPHDYGLLREEATFLRKERDYALTEVKRLKATVNQQLTVRPEPSRLEIAAMMMAANLSRETEQWDTYVESTFAVEQADGLIAAAKEGK
jgi:hypothetical protein